MEPTQEWIEEKKKTTKVYAVTIGSEKYYFRPAKRGEHLSMQKEAFPDGVPTDPDGIKAEDNARLEDIIVKRCVLWPEDINPQDLDAGAPQMIVAMVMKYSGFGMVTEPEEV